MQRQHLLAGARAEGNKGAPRVAGDFSRLRSVRSPGRPRPHYGDKLVRKWDGTQDGNPLVGLNEVFMTPGGGGDWTQRMTVDVDGKRVTDMTIIHHRVR